MTRRALACAALLGLAACATSRTERADEVARFDASLVERTTALAPGPGRVLALSECEALATAQNLAYRTTLLEARLRDDEVAAATTAFFPRGGIDARAQARNSDPLVKTPGGAAAFEDRDLERFHVGMVLPILDFGATWQAYRIVEDQRAQARLVAVRARQTLLRDVRVTYTRFAEAVRARELLTAEVDASREALRAARALEREGLAAPADGAFVEAALARAEMDLAVARRDARTARAALSRTMSVPVWSEYAIDTRAPALPRLPEQMAEVHALEDAALRSRPEVFLQDRERDVAASRVRRAFAALFPHVDLTADLETSSNSFLVNPTFVSAGVSVAQSLFDLPANAALHRLAQGREPIEAQRALVVAMGVVYEVDFRLLELARARDAATAREAQVVAQERLLAQTSSRYREGLESSAEATRALADFHAAKRALDHARTDAAIAAIELRTAVASDDAAAVLVAPVARATDAPPAADATAPATPPAPAPASPAPPVPSTDATAATARPAAPPPTSPPAPSPAPTPDVPGAPR